MSVYPDETWCGTHRPAWHSAEEPLTHHQAASARWKFGEGHELVGDGAQTWLAGSFQAAAEDGGWDSNDMDRLGGGGGEMYAMGTCGEASGRFWEGNI